MLRKIVFLFTLCIFAFGAWTIYESSKERAEVAKESKGWDKFEKKNNKTSFTHAKTLDLEAHKVPKATLKRTPAAQNSFAPMREGRHLEGERSSKFSNPTEALKMQNRVSKDWKQKLGHNLTRFQDEGTEVLIKREKGLIFVNQGYGQYREQVLISYKMADGRRSSYRAMIDSSNGKIIYTFNRQIDENFRRRPTGLSHPLAQ